MELNSCGASSRLLRPPLICRRCCVCAPHTSKRLSREPLAHVQRRSRACEQLAAAARGSLERRLRLPWESFARDSWPDAARKSLNGRTFLRRCRLRLTDLKQQVNSGQLRSHFHSAVSIQAELPLGLPLSTAAAASGGHATGSPRAQIELSISVGLLAAAVEDRSPTRRANDGPGNLIRAPRIRSSGAPIGRARRGTSARARSAII